MMGAISRVLIVGYGVMGRGIAKSFAASGFETAVLSRHPDQAKDVPPGVEVTGAWPKNPPDLVIESVPEIAETKRKTFAAIEAEYGGRTIIATNSSGLPLPELEKDLKHPEKFLGTHYFMPADSSAAVEIMAGTRTGADALEEVATAIRKTGKYAFVLRRPITGWLINRLQHALWHETYHLLSSGVASADEIDQAARLVIGPRLCISGLLEQKDIGGLQIHADAQRSIVPVLEHSGVPNRYVQAMVKRGENGIASGLGFYDWRGVDRKRAMEDANHRLKQLLAFLQSLGARDAKLVPTPRKIEIEIS
jgi:3-hydroxybutyryl-CoA dehydrogenase